MSVSLGGYGCGSHGGSASFGLRRTGLLQVAYLDPMFPSAKRKSALPKRRMQVLGLPSSCVSEMPQGCSKMERGGSEAGERASGPLRASLRGTASLLARYAARPRRSQAPSLCASLSLSDAQLRKSPPPRPPWSSRQSPQPRRSRVSGCGTTSPAPTPRKAARPET